jgi:hypothetical protein
VLRVFREFGFLQVHVSNGLVSGISKAPPWGVVGDVYSTRTTHVLLMRSYFQ